MQCHAGFIPTEVVTQAASSYMPIHAMSSDQAGHRGQDATLARFRMRYCMGTTWEHSKISENELSAVQVVRRKLSGAADGTTAGSKTAFNHAMLDLFGSIIWYEERSPKMHQCQSIIMVLCSQTWHGGPYTSRQCLDMTQAISWWLSADLQIHVSVYGRRKLTVTEVLNLWVRRGSSRNKPGKRLIDWKSLQIEKLRTEWSDQLGHLVLLILLGIKKQLNR